MRSPLLSTGLQPLGLSQQVNDLEGIAWGGGQGVLAASGPGAKAIANRGRIEAGGGAGLVRRTLEGAVGKVGGGAGAGRCRKARETARQDPGSPRPPRALPTRPNPGLSGLLGPVQPRAALPAPAGATRRERLRGRSPGPGFYFGHHIISCCDFFSLLIRALRTVTAGVETIQSSSRSHDRDQRDGVPHPGTADCLGEPAPVRSPRGAGFPGRDGKRPESLPSSFPGQLAELGRWSPWAAAAGAPTTRGPPDQLRELGRKSPDRGER
ncbi:uncharacterized protein LOC143675492 [Tamandua tetradactyla]|uniref:uncharacterized protein LOC143675492 n=1 Tax=Tamandua tetradactyla TaxID=48850 RepID=UPI004053F28D